MNTVVRCAVGKFRGGEIRRYLACGTGLFWSLIFLAWVSYPAEHHYSIMTHTFSFLGSFEDRHNPEWWWIFSLAMLTWGIGAMPVVLYLHDRFTPISKWGARLGAFLMLAGCCGVVLVALFPDAHGKVLGNLEWTDIHERAAVLIAIGFTLGIVLHGVLLLKDRYGGGRPPRFYQRGMLWPYLFWMAATGTAACVQVRWEHVYAAKKATAAATGDPIGSSWAEALNTWYSFPLWENLAIYTLFIFLVWFTLAASHDKAGQAQE